MAAGQLSPARPGAIFLLLRSNTNNGQFGYDQGVFGGLVTNNDFLDIVGHPSSGYLGIIVSIYNIGCLLGCLINFAIGGRFGRRQAIWVAMALICTGAVIQTTTYGVPQLMVGRIITGLGVGIDTSTVS